MQRAAALIGLAILACGCQQNRTASVAPVERPKPVTEREFSPKTVAIDQDRIYLGGLYGELRIHFEPWQTEGQVQKPGVQKVSEWSRIENIELGENGYAVGELDGSGGINTYLYRHDTLVAVIPGMDYSTFQFTRDGRYLVVTSYNQLTVIECETGKSGHRKEIGEMFRDSIELIPGGEGRFARLRTQNKDYVPRITGWWDPVTNRAISAPTPANADDLVWRAAEGFRKANFGDQIVGATMNYLVYRTLDRKKYIVKNSSTLAPLGEIDPEGDQLASQMFRLVGEHGFAVINDDIELYDLRSRQRIARIIAGNPTDRDFLVVTENGYHFGNLDPKGYGYPKSNFSPEKVRAALIKGCGIAEKE